ncbi:MAG: MFS transporter [Ilumatobacteraceae bacterium]
MSNTFRSLGVRNFRLWFVGQTVSRIGFFVQLVAQALLVLELTDSGPMLGIFGSLQFIPSLLFGPWAGLMCDRLDKRRLLLMSQTMLMLLAFVLGALVLFDWVTLPRLFVLALVTGMVWCFDQPARRTFVTELVPEEDAANAISLNGALDHASKIVGPALGGVMYATIGSGWCFIVNGLTSLAVLAGLLRMDDSQIKRTNLMTRAKGQIREGLRYVRSNRDVRLQLVLLGSASVFSCHWATLLPLFATRDLHGGPGTFPMLMATMSVGALAGLLFLARLHDVPTHLIASASIALGASWALLSISPTAWCAALSVAGMGAASIGVLNGGMAGLQLKSIATMRGRVMGFFSMAVLGGVALGAPLLGWIADALGTRDAARLSGAAAVFSGLVMHVVLRTPHDRARPARMASASFGPESGSAATNALEMGGLRYMRFLPRPTSGKLESCV